MRKAVFLDRDGTLIKDIPYINDPKLVELLPYVIEGLKMLKNLGFILIIVTNQSGIKRGYFDEDTLQRIHHKILHLLKEKGIEIDAIYYCPCLPDEGCECRKPNPGMIVQATEEFNIDLKKSYIIGDSWMDIGAGKSVGCTSILLFGREKDLSKLKKMNIAPDYIAKDFMDAVNYIIKQEKHKRGGSKNDI